MEKYWVLIEFTYDIFKLARADDAMSNPAVGEGKVPEPLDPRDNPKVLTLEDLEKAALGGGGTTGGGDGGGGEGEVKGWGSFTYDVGKIWGYLSLLSPRLMY